MTLAAAALLLAAAPSAWAQAPAAESAQPFAAAAPGASARLARGMVAHLRQAGVARPSGRVAVWIGAGNRNPRVSLAETNVPPALWNGVGPLVDAYLAARAETTPLELSFYLERLAETDDTRPAGEVRSESPPRLRTMDHVVRSLTQIASVHPDYADDDSLSVKAGLRMLIDRRGRPALVENHLRGDPQFDRYLTALAYELRFDPARVNGAPVSVWMEGPNGFEVYQQR